MSHFEREAKIKRRLPIGDSPHRVGFHLGWALRLPDNRQRSAFPLCRAGGPLSTGFGDLYSLLCSPSLSTPRSNVSHSQIVILFSVPVLLWAALSYSLLPYVIVEAESNLLLDLGIFVLWAAGSVIYFILLRRFARWLRARTQGSLTSWS